LRIGSSPRFFHNGVKHVEWVHKVSHLISSSGTAFQALHAY
jgi:hypothetical protein